MRLFRGHVLPHACNNPVPQMLQQAPSLQCSHVPLAWRLERMCRCPADNYACRGGHPTLVHDVCRWGGCQDGTWRRYPQLQPLCYVLSARPSMQLSHVHFLQLRLWRTTPHPPHWPVGQCILFFCLMLALPLPLLSPLLQKQTNNVCTHTLPSFPFVRTLACPAINSRFWL